MSKTVAVVLFSLLGLDYQALPQQQAEPERPGAVFSVTSTLVQIDAVVTDGKGHYTNDLGPSDFDVLVDGKAQKITHFSYVRVTGNQTPRVAATRPRSRQKERTLPPAPAAPLRREDLRRTTVLIVDDLGLSFESMAYTRRAVRKFIEEQMQPGDLVAICRTGSGSGIAQQFTNDKRVLRAIADGLRWSPTGRYGAAFFEPVGIYGHAGSPGNVSGDYDAADLTYQAERNEMLSVGTLGAINFIVGALGELPGRKSIVLFSDGFAMTSYGGLPRLHTGPGSPSAGANPARIIEAFRRLVDRANRSGTIIYTIHATGLQTLQPTAQDNPFAGMQGVSTQEAQGTFDTLMKVGEIDGRDVQFQMQQQGLAYLAYETGGLPYENGNDMNWALDRILEDQAGYYLMGFRPPENLFEGKHGEAPYHRIRIRVNRPGLHVRTRTGFFGETDLQAMPRFTATDQMRMAMLSPFRSYDVRLRLTSLFSKVAKDDEIIVRNLIHIDTRDLRFDLNGDGTISAHVDVVAAVTEAEGAAVKTLLEPHEFRVSSDRVRTVLSEGALFAMDVPLRRPGAYQIRVALRDQATGKIGSASQFLEIPDMAKRRLALTSLVLLDGNHGVVSSGLLGMSPARRQFHPGDKIEYFCLALVRKAPTRLNAQVRVMRDNNEILSAPAEIVNVDGTQVVRGQVRLTDAVRPGEYNIGVVVSNDDKNAGIDGQWTDFEVVAN